MTADEGIVDNETEVFDPVYDIRFTYKLKPWLSDTLRIGDSEPIMLTKKEVFALYDVLRRVSNEIGKSP